MFGTQKSHGDEEILRAQDIIEKEIARCPSVEALAHRVAMSRRSFVRRFKGATGNAPRDYLQRVRKTKKLLELMDTRAKVFTKSEMEAAFQHLEGSHWAQLGPYFRGPPGL